MGVVASPDYVEHDTYILFEKIMEVTKTWFESNQRQGEAEVNQGVCCFPFLFSICRNFVTSNFLKNSDKKVGTEAGLFKKNNERSAARICSSSFHSQ